MGMQIPAALGLLWIDMTHIPPAILRSLKRGHVTVVVEPAATKAVLGLTGCNTLNSNHLTRHSCPPPPPPGVGPQLQVQAVLYSLSTADSAINHFTV